MSKGYMWVTFGSLAGAVFFYGRNAFISLVLFVLFMFCMYAAGKV